MATQHDDAVRDYLARLRDATTDLPEPVRRDLLAEIEADIRAELAEIPAPSHFDVLNILERVGDPVAIAEAARTDISTVPSRPLGSLLLAIAAVLFTPFAWPVGALLLWLSPFWSRGEKLFGTLVVPGGVWAALALANRVGPSQKCWGHVVNGRPVIDGCDPPSWAMQLLGAGDILLIILPLISAGYLAVRLIQRERLYSRS